MDDDRALEDGLWLFEPGVEVDVVFMDARDIADFSRAPNPPVVVGDAGLLRASRAAEEEELLIEVGVAFEPEDNEGEDDGREKTSCPGGGVIAMTGSAGKEEG